MRWTGQRTHLVLALLCAFACESSRDRPSGTNNNNNNNTHPDATASDGASTDGFVLFDGGNQMGDGSVFFDGGIVMVDAGTIGMFVPDPGTNVGTDWTDVEPNDTASQATPVGILNNPAWLGFAMPLTTINTNTDTDFYVFKTASSVDGVSLSACWSGSIDLLNMYLYIVNNSQVGSMIKSSESTNTQCETLIAPGAAAMDLQPDTTYVLEIRAAPGINLGGAEAGLYSA